MAAVLARSHVRHPPAVKRPQVAAGVLAQHTQRLQILRYGTTAVVGLQARPASERSVRSAAR